MRKLLFIMLLLPVVFLAGGLFLPSQVQVERSIAIQRPPATVFTVLNSYTHFEQWSPWAQLDPDVEFLVTGPASGPGARISWDGDPALIGSGWQEIVASEPWSSIDMQLDFGPQGVTDSRFTINGDSLGSRVTWSFDSDVTAGQNFLSALMSRYFGLFLEGWVGSDYEQGLAALKQYVETLPEGDFSAADISQVEVPAVELLSVSGSTTQDAVEISAALDAAFARIAGFMSATGVAVTGPPLTITRRWADGVFDYTAAIPSSHVPAVLPEDISAGPGPSGPAVRIVHRGPYSTAGASYALLQAWLAAHGLQAGPLSWEVYVDDPALVPEQELRTEIYYQLAAER
jgi:effector-binding domain-containing protein